MLNDASERGHEAPRNRNRPHPRLLVAALVLGVTGPHISQTSGGDDLDQASLLEGDTPPNDWRPLDLENTLYVELEKGRVVIELSPQFAPRLIANIKLLVRERYFDGLSIVRTQDNYVVQWGDPDQTKTLGTATGALLPEFERSTKGLEFSALVDRDTYAPETGFAYGFPVARDIVTDKAWLVHCYGMVGASRDSKVDSGNGADLYVVIGQAPRQLDRNTTLVGRVVQGMELISGMPRGMDDLGFYRSSQERPRIRSIRSAADVEVEERVGLEVMRTDTKAFFDVVRASRFQDAEWFRYTSGHIDVCNVRVPLRHTADSVDRK